MRRIEDCDVIVLLTFKSLLLVGFHPHGTVEMIADAHRDDGKRIVVHADELLTAFLELE